MSMPTNLPVIDCMIGFPSKSNPLYDRVNEQVKDGSAASGSFPAAHLYKDQPASSEQENEDPVAATLAQMDRYGIDKGLISIDGDVGKRAIHDFPTRFIGSCSVDPNDVMGEVRKIRHLHAEFGIRAVYSYPHACKPPVAIDDAKYYPIYAVCCDLDIPIFVTAGVPGPKLPMVSQKVELIDQVMYDFPDLTFVTRHGCEPWEDLAIKLMLKWRGLHFSTSAFAPKYYSNSIIDYANTRGADKILYAGYFPFGLSLETIFSQLPDVPFRDHVWPKFLYENAARVLRL